MKLRDLTRSAGVALAVPALLMLFAPDVAAAGCPAVVRVDTLREQAARTCVMAGRTVNVKDLNLTVPRAGWGMGQSVARVEGSDPSKPSEVELWHSAAGGVAVSVDGAAPVGEAKAVAELRSQQRAAVTRLETAPLAVANSYPSWCGSARQYAFEGPRWAKNRYQWYANPSGRPAGMTNWARSVAFKAAAANMSADKTTCGGAANDLVLGEIGSTTKSAGVLDGKNTQGWKRLSSGILALTTWWYTGGSMVEADMEFSTTVKWYAWTGAVPSSSFDLMSIAEHEIGHAVGLEHVSSTPRQIMYPSFRPGEARRTKRSGDLNGIGIKY